MRYSNLREAVEECKRFIAEAKIQFDYQKEHYNTYRRCYPNESLSLKDWETNIEPSLRATASKVGVMAARSRILTESLRRLRRDT